MTDYLNYWLRKVVDETPNDMDLGSKVRNMVWETENKGPERTDEWVLEQYNRNRAPEDWVKRIEDISVFDRNPDTNEINNYKPIPPCRGYDLDSDGDLNDCGDAFDY
jgi:hypothetical protein